MRVLADQRRVDELVAELSQAIRHGLGNGGEPWALVGVRSRGDVLAGRIADRLGRASGSPSHGDSAFRGVGTLDITLYRDDLSEIGPQPVVRTTEVPFALDGVNVVLVDDVLMTGRSVRAALESLMDLGRPRRVWLAVLVDRGGRELPIQPDHVGLDLSREPLAEHEQVQVRLAPTDDQDAVVIA